MGSGSSPVHRTSWSSRWRVTSARPTSWRRSCASFAIGATRRVRWLLLKDLQILRRSPLLVAMLILYPILLAALVGFALTSGPSKPRVALVNAVRESQRQVTLGGESVNLSQEAKPLFDAIDVVRVNSEDEAIQKVKDG